MLFSRWSRELNLFESNAIDDDNIRLQRLSTRLYISTFTISFFIFGVYALLHSMILHVEIENLTIEEYERLQDKYSLDCDCSETSIFHEEFLQLRPIYHQVCSSDFVTQRWIDYLFDINKTLFYFPADFRSTASQQFQLLADLCQLSTQGVNDGLNSFFQTELISQKLMSRVFFITEIQSYIDAFKTNTLNAFNYKLMIIRQLIEGNALLPSAQTIVNFTIQLFDYEIWHYWTLQINNNVFLQPDGQFCSCPISSTCHGQGGFFGSTADNSSVAYLTYFYTIDGWYIGCRPIDSLLLSTLKTFYNQTMLDLFLQFFHHSPSNFTCLNANDTITFDPKNATLETIVKSSFIEKWSQQINYSLYFNHCKAKACSYTFNKRFNIYYILTGIIGLYGGLSITLRFIAPTIIKFLFERKEERTTQNLSVKQPKQLARFCMQQLTSAFWKLNLFRSSTQVEPADINHQRWSTRLYTILLLSSFIILTMYTAMTPQTVGVDLINPSVDTVLDLQKKPGISSLQCPCSQLASSLKYFIELYPTYHEVCFSQFISDAWIEQISSVPLNNANDFGNSGPIFKLLRSFCQLANATVYNALKLFDETQIVTITLLASDIFISTMSSEINYFQLVTPTRLYYPLELMRETMRANQFISLARTNYDLSLVFDAEHFIFKIQPVSYWINDINRACSILLDRECKMQTIIVTYDEYGNVTIFRVPGFYTSAYYMQSLLLSNLQCLYNQSCLNSIFSLFRSTVYYGALRKPSRFPHNVTFNSLVRNLFVESWSQRLNYTAYFEQCQPHSCSYTISQRSAFVLVITTVIGLSSGLSVVLRLLSPWIITFILTRCRRQQTTPTESIQQEGKNMIRSMSVMS